MSEDKIEVLKERIALEQSELRIALRDHNYARAVAIASMILEYVAQVSELGMTQSQEVAQ